MSDKQKNEDQDPEVQITNYEDIPEEPPNEGEPQDDVTEEEDE